MFKVTPTPEPIIPGPSWYQDWAKREQQCSGSPAYRPGGEIDIATAWEAMQGVYARMSYGTMPNPWATSCEVRSYTQGVCIHQAIVGYGILRNDYGVGDDLIFVSVYEWSKGDPHAILTVSIGGEYWLFDRNYGPNYPRMPMREREYLRLWLDIRVVYRFNMHWYDGPMNAILNFQDSQLHNLL